MAITRSRFFFKYSTYYHGRKKGTVAVVSFYGVLCTLYMMSSKSLSHEVYRYTPYVLFFGCVLSILHFAFEKQWALGLSDLLHEINSMILMRAGRGTVLECVSCMHVPLVPRISA